VLHQLSLTITPYAFAKPCRKEAEGKCFSQEEFYF
jgi:hypothetical protein